MDSPLVVGCGERHVGRFECTEPLIPTKNVSDTNTQNLNEYSFRVDFGSPAPDKCPCRLKRRLMT